jgi:Tfp pilus assembly PilM family ATPase
MARVLAIDWDGHEARCVLGSASGGKIQVVAANSAPLVSVAQGGGQSRPDVAGSLRAALGDDRPGRITTIVGVNRASVDLMNFTLPPAKDRELAQLVQIQAARESQSLDEGAALDFLPMSEGPAESREVMAAVLPAAQRKGIEEACEGAGLRAAHIVLRPLAASSLFLRTASPERPCLLVNLVADEADLTVISEGRVVFLRTVRLPEDVNEYVAAQRLSAEVTRTLVVAQQGPLAGSSVEQIHVYGGPGEHEVLVQQLELDLGLPVSTLDPFETADITGVELPPSAGRFASLLGMVLDESRSAHALDFLHPRRPPRPPNRRRMVLTAAAAVAAIVLCCGYSYWDLLDRAKADNRRLAQDIKLCNESLKQYSEQKRITDDIREWRVGDVIWLDELRDLSLRMPSSRDVVLQHMTMTDGRRGGAGVIQVRGRIRDPSVVARIDRSLHDVYHTVASRRVGERPRGEDYAWLFDRSITVLPRPKSQYLAQQGAKP